MIWKPFTIQTHFRWYCQDGKGVLKGRMASFLQVSWKRRTLRSLPMRIDSVCDDHNQGSRCNVYPIVHEVWSTRTSPKFTLRLVKVPSIRRVMICAMILIVHVPSVHGWQTRLSRLREKRQTTWPVSFLSLINGDIPSEYYHLGGKFSDFSCPGYWLPTVVNIQVSATSVQCHRKPILV